MYPVPMNRAVADPKTNSSDAQVPSYNSWKPTAPFMSRSHEVATTAAMCAAEKARRTRLSRGNPPIEKISQISMMMYPRRKICISLDERSDEPSERHDP
jgi:hypothetical protein